MPKRSTQPPPPLVKQFRPEEIDPAIVKLRRRLEEVRALAKSGVRYNDESVTIVASKISSTILDVFGPDSPEFREHQYYRIWHGPMNLMADAASRQRSVEGGFVDTEKVLEGLISGIEEKRADLNVDPTARVRAAFDQLDLHPRIADVASDLYRGGNFRNAVLDATIALTNLVKEKSREQDRDGVDLMRHVFSPRAPVLAFNDLADVSDRDEQEGLMNLFVGAVQALRNPRAHDVQQDTAEYALECIAFLSFLAKRLARARRTAP